MSKSEGQVLDFEKICRLCLLEKRSMSSIFSKKKSDKKVPLPVRIMSCASLELYEGDGLPASICSKCLLSVNQSYAFREQCEQADTTLRQYAQRMNEASGETSSNREPWERIAKGSLERIEDNGIIFEESQVRGSRNNDEDHSRSKNLESHCENNAVAFGEFVVNPEEKEFILRKVENIIERPIKDREGISCAAGEEGDYICKMNCSKPSKEMRFSKRISSKVCEINGKITRKSSAAKQFHIPKTFQSPVLEALSKKKAENVVVIADVPGVCEGEDCDVGETVDEDDLLLAKTRSTKLFRSRLKRGFLSSPPVDTDRFIGENSQGENNRENDRDRQLLQSLMKNKNIVVRCSDRSSTECPEEKVSVFKKQEFSNRLHGQKNFLLPRDLKIAQFWREWEEVSERVPDGLHSQEGLYGLERQNEVWQDSKDDPAAGGQNKNPSEPVPMRANPQDPKAGQNHKIKWKNARDTVYCKDCRIFLMRSSYNNHIKFVHKKIRKYLCQTCGYAAYTGTILRQHVQAVHVGYSFFCDQCPKKFNLMKRLRKHMEAQHSGKPIPRNHICQYCGMAFSKPGCLTRHLRSHTQETPYQCQYCQRRFKYRWPKVQHERLHTGEKPYKCSFCEERFTQNCVRKAHEYKKHGNEEFKPKARVKENAVEGRMEKESSGLESV